MEPEMATICEEQLRLVTSSVKKTCSWANLIELSLDILVKVALSKATNLCSLLLACEGVCMIDQIKK